MRLIIENDYESMSEWAARYVGRAIRAHRPTSSDPFVLGLPTGSTPIGIYRHLIKLHQTDGLSFKHVVTFNMDEYIGLAEDHPQSYHRFMEEHFFKHIDIPKENIHIPNGNAPDIIQECYEYEKTIASFGGVDLFLGGIGSDGHIAFNEPFSSFDSQTRVKRLTIDTRAANSRFFNDDINKVPELAVTVGIKTIMDAQQIVILVNGYGKTRALQAMIEGPMTQMWPCSILQSHSNCLVVCDEEAANELKVSTYKYFKKVEAGTPEASD
ncbi:MAG: glucosamine-6-phosphate deaminase [Sphaerochaetaceae bacterium]